MCSNGIPQPDNVVDAQLKPSSLDLHTLHVTERCSYLTLNLHQRESTLWKLFNTSQCRTMALIPGCASLNLTSIIMRIEMDYEGRKIKILYCNFISALKKMKDVEKRWMNLHHYRP